MGHIDYMEFALDDGAQVRLELSPAGEAPTPPDGGADLPEGMAGVTPVGRGARVGALATDALRTVLSPLGPVLQQVHDSVRGIPDPPHEISVDFGIQIGQDLKIGIVGANGQASMTISATWQIPRGTET
ncbi:CU044_2847 family protein [Streptomyces sp. NPDC001020]